MLNSLCAILLLFIFFPPENELHKRLLEGFAGMCWESLICKTPGRLRQPDVFFSMFIIVFAFLAVTPARKKIGKTSVSNAFSCTAPVRFHHFSRCMYIFRPMLRASPNKAPKACCGCISPSTTACDSYALCLINISPRAMVFWCLYYILYKRFCQCFYRIFANFQL